MWWQSSVTCVKHLVLVFQDSCSQTVNGSHAAPFLLPQCVPSCYQCHRNAHHTQQWVFKSTRTQPAKRRNIIETCHDNVTTWKVVMELQSFGVSAHCFALPLWFTFTSVIELFPSAAASCFQQKSSKNKLYTTCSAHSAASGSKWARNFARENKIRGMREWILKHFRLQWNYNVALI